MKRSLTNGLSGLLFFVAFPWQQALFRQATLKSWVNVLQLATYIKDTLKKIKSILADKYHVSTIGLFGSVVRDDYSPASSDIDIIVDFSRPIGIEFVDLANYLEKILNKKVDLVSKRGIKIKYFAHIEPEIVYV